ncbi:pirin family protein [Agitococcus lubricus]|uniref:Pirin N-terminal domain-containing protein n=1 Tax=Agitococcus lubricus TaxID=1077255 RepID=A0A2T5J2D0_9GAMM|nr:pirin family protein [Agitococcus lubricus]PTQ90647.1 hypothetical protein C8N29_10246 [Agitococcus lubricus]
MEKISAKTTELGKGMMIRRLLPTKKRRMIGAWCFLDHIAPTQLDEQGMRVGPHPHTGLQTFTWMIEGEILHRDSLGYQQRIQPKQVNLMTAGRGISHSEESPIPHTGRLHAAQLWIALPEAYRHCSPDFQHYPHLPSTDYQGYELTVLVGSYQTLHAPTQVYSPLIALDIRHQHAGSGEIALRSDFEYGLIVLSGEATVAEQQMGVGDLLVFEAGELHQLPIRQQEACHLLLIGGQPFTENIVLWWNFIARQSAEIEGFVNSWNQGQDFGEVKGYQGERLIAPELSPAIQLKASS